MFKVKVPATSANLGVGFDTLGLALNLYNEFTFTEADSFGFEGFLSKYANKDNMVLRAYKYLFSKADKEAIPVIIGAKCDIPVSRGLGSSSSLIVAGLIAANKMLGNIYSINELFNFAANMEGHPDNVAPACFGGLVASFKNSLGIYEHISYEVNNDLKFYVIIPSFEMKTSDSRNVLPKELPYKDIVNNISKIVNIPYAFARGDISLIKELLSDKLHEPYRLPLIPKALEIKEAINSLGKAFALSGSGSTMLVISDSDSVSDVIKKFDYDYMQLQVSEGAKIGE